MVLNDPYWLCWGLYVLLETEPGSVAYKVSTLLSELSLWPILIPFISLSYPKIKLLVILLLLQHLL